MHASIKLVAIGAIATFASLGAMAQTSNGADYRPMQLNSPDNPDVQKGAIEAARNHGGAGSEGVGSTTAPKPTTNTANQADIDKGALAAARNHGGAGSEGAGSSTAAPLPQSSGG